MRAAQHRDVLVELHAGVVILHRDEERLAEAIAASEIERGVGERAALAGDERPAIRTRAIFPRQLEAELVEQRVGEGAHQLTGHGMRRVALDRVGAAAPGVDVERPVLLIGVGVVVAQCRHVAGAGGPVGLQQQDARVVGAADGAVFVGGAELGQRVDHPLLDAPRLRLFGRFPFLVVECGEVEEAIAHKGAAQGETGLVLAGLEFRRLAAVGILRIGAQAVVLADQVRGPFRFVRPRLGDDVHEAGLRAAELCVGAVGHHHHLFDRIEIEGEGGPLSAALLAEEGVVEVGAIDGDVVGNSLLAVDRELIAVRALDDGHSRSELGQLQEVAAVVRQLRHGLVINARRSLGACRLDQRRSRGHHDLLGHGGLLEAHRERQRLADREVEASGYRSRESLQRRSHLIRTEWQEHAAETAGGIGDGLLLEIRGGVAHGHRHPG